jgi:tetratricopeptide (TPR) repeat protein
MSLQQLAQAFHLTGPAIHHLESGRNTLTPERLALFAEAMRYAPEEVEAYRRVVEAHALLDLAATSMAEGDSLAVEADARRVRVASAGHGLVIQDQFGEELGGMFSRTDVNALRRAAGRTFRTWIVAPPAVQRLLVEGHSEYQTQGMIEQIGLVSERSAAKDPRLPLHYAQLALRAAQRLRGPAALKSAVEGWAWAYVGNAKRVGANLREADQAFGQSSRLWRVGAQAKELFLEKWRLPDLEASLRRDQRRWKECLVLSDQALAEAPESARGRVLIKKATALQQMGEARRALQALEEATPFIVDKGEPDLLLALRFNQAVSLNHLGDLAKARRYVEEARGLAVELGRELHVLRCIWISGRITGEAGAPEEAVALLRQARHDFTTRMMPLEAAGAALDEALNLLKMNETERVAELATEVAWVFAAEGVGEDPLKALRLFYEAARTRRLTLEIAQEARERFLNAG